MDKHRARGKWKGVAAGVKREWGKLTDDDLKKAEGNFDALIARIQEKYGESRESISAKLKKMKE